MRTTLHHDQRGVLLLEVLVALLIFSLGVLGLIGLQANANKQSGETKYRADATLMANELFGQMRLASRDFTELNTRFKSADGGGADYLAWKARVVAQMPGASTYPPTVTLTQVSPLQAIVNGGNTAATGLSASTVVNVIIRWKAPNAPASEPVHSVALSNEIR